MNLFKLWLPSVPCEADPPFILGADLPFLSKCPWAFFISMICHLIAPRRESHFHKKETHENPCAPPFFLASPDIIHQRLDCRPVRVIDILPVGAEHRPVIVSLLPFLFSVDEQME